MVICTRPPGMRRSVGTCVTTGSGIASRAFFPWPTSRRCTLPRFRSALVAGAKTNDSPTITTPAATAGANRRPRPKSHWPLVRAEALGMVIAFDATRRPEPDGAEAAKSIGPGVVRKITLSQPCTASRVTVECG